MTIHFFQILVYPTCSQDCPQLLCGNISTLLISTKFLDFRDNDNKSMEIKNSDTSISNFPLPLLILMLMQESGKVSILKINSSASYPENVADNKNWTVNSTFWPENKSLLRNLHVNISNNLPVIYNLDNLNVTSAITNNERLNAQSLVQLSDKENNKVQTNDSLEYSQVEKLVCYLRKH